MYVNIESMSLISCRNLIQFIGSLVFMIQLTWKLATVTIMGIPLITVVTKLFGEKLKVPVTIVLLCVLQSSNIIN